MTSKIADDSASIAQRLKEIEAEKMAAIMGKPIEGEPVEAPKDIDWTGMYGQAYAAFKQECWAHDAKMDNLQRKFSGLDWGRIKASG